MRLRGTNKARSQKLELENEMKIVATDGRIGIRGAVAVVIRLPLTAGTKLHEETQVNKLQPL